VVGVDVAAGVAVGFRVSEVVGSGDADGEGDGAGVVVAVDVGVLTVG